MKGHYHFPTGVSVAESLKRVAGISIFPVGRGMKRNDFPESDGTKKPPMHLAPEAQEFI